MTDVDIMRVAESMKESSHSFIKQMENKSNFIQNKLDEIVSERLRTGARKTDDDIKIFELKSKTAKLMSKMKELSTTLDQALIKKKMPNSNHVVNKPIIGLKPSSPLPAQRLQKDSSLNQTTAYKELTELKKKLSLLTGTQQIQELELILQ